VRRDCRSATSRTGQLAKEAQSRQQTSLPDGEGELSLSCIPKTMQVAQNQSTITAPSGGIDTPLAGQFRFCGFMQEYHWKDNPHRSKLGLPRQKAVAVLDGQQPPNSAKHRATNSYASGASSAGARTKHSPIPLDVDSRRRATFRASRSRRVAIRSTRASPEVEVTVEVAKDRS
jgi:hypothetical protein